MKSRREQQPMRTVDRIVAIIIFATCVALVQGLHHIMTPRTPAVMHATIDEHMEPFP
jgi:hypothetical protein